MSELEESDVDNFEEEDNSPPYARNRDRRGETFTDAQRVDSVDDYGADTAYLNDRGKAQEEQSQEGSHVRGHSRGRGAEKRSPQQNEPSFLSQLRRSRIDQKIPSIPDNVKRKNLLGPAEGRYVPQRREAARQSNAGGGEGSPGASRAIDKQR